MNHCPDISGEIISLYVGEVENRWVGKAPSAIGKKPTKVLLRLEENGFVEDNQADLKVHGGPEKAIHHYAAEHMDFWKKKFPDHAEKFMPGCFGENISTIGLSEENLCLGDILTMGSATVQICQGRQPCWKLNAHMDISQMAAAFQTTARTGWYYRVLHTGNVQSGNRIRLIERLNPDWTLARLIKARFDPKLNAADALELSLSEVISQNWSEAFNKKQDTAFEEDTTSRLQG